MTVSLDTSVLVAALTEEPRSDDAARMLGLSESWVITDWAAAEFSAAIRTKARRGELLSSQTGFVEASFDAVIARLGGTVAVTPEDHRRTRMLVIADGLIRAPDALHIIVAQRLGASLATFDIDQMRAAKAAGVEIYS